MSNKLPPEMYNLRATTLQIVRNLLEKELFSTEKDALLFVCFKAEINGAQSGFNLSEALGSKIPEVANKVYGQYKKFKSSFDTIEEDHE